MGKLKGKRSGGTWNPGLTSELSPRLLPASGSRGAWTPSGSFLGMCVGLRKFERGPGFGISCFCSVLYFLLLLFCLLHLLDFYSLTVSEFSATAELVLSDMFVVLAHILPYSSS